MISLSKFSHCANIAKYYGEYTDILCVLSLLCQKTRETCASFRYAFRVCLNAQKKSIQYMKPFDQKFSKLIQSENRWMCYKPKITVTDKKGRQALVDLIHAVNEIEFDEINIEISEQDTYIKAREETLQEVNEIYHAMLEEKTDINNTSCINVNFLDYKVSDFPFPVEYTRSAHYKTLEEYTRFSHVGNLVKEITGAEEFKKLCNLGILCNEITIDSIIWNFLFSYNLEGKIPEQFALMVQKVKLAKYEMEFTNVMKLRDIFPNLKEVAFDVELSSEEFNPQKLFSEAIQDGVSCRFYFSPKVKRKMKKPLLAYWRKGNPIELENVNVYYTFAENNYTVAFQAQKFGFDLGKAKILKSDSRFMTLETFECCELENISNYCNVDLEDYRDFSCTNSVSREVHPDHIVIEKKNFTFIGNPHYMLSIKPKEAKVIDLDLTTVKN